jgi:hypothetical protein
MAKIITFFAEDNGNLSMTRLVLFLGFTITLTAWLVAALHASVSGTIPDMPASILGFHSLLLGSKLGQKALEQPRTAENK